MWKTDVRWEVVIFGMWKLHKPAIFYILQINKKTLPNSSINKVLEDIKNSFEENLTSDERF